MLTCCRHIQFNDGAIVKHHVTHLVCVHDARKCLLCIFVSPLLLLHPFFLSILCITIYLHLSILAPVGIGKRCSSLPAWPLPSHGHQSVIPKPPTACPLISQSTSSKHEAPHVIAVVHNLRYRSQSVKTSKSNHFLSSLECWCSQTALPVPKHVVWAWDMMVN